MKPVSLYAASKLSGEVLCTTYARANNLSTVILRLFNVYGPSADGKERNTVEAIFLHRVAQELPPMIKGDPDEGRDFVHIQDVIRVIQCVLNVNLKGEIINIGSGKMTLLLELARLVINLSGKSLDAVIEGQPSGEPMCLQADMRKVLRL